MLFLSDFDRTRNFLLIFSKTITVAFRNIANTLKRPANTRSPAKFLSFLQADDMMPPNYMLVRNRYIRGLLADTNILNTFSNTRVMFEHSEFHSGNIC